MTDTVSSTVLVHDVNRYVLRLTNVCDGTGEAAVIKVDRSGVTIVGQSPAVAVGHIAIERIQGNIYGFSYVRLLWHHTANDFAATLAPGIVDLDWRDYGGVHDPKSGGGTGDLLLTTAGNTAGDIYDLTLDCRFYS